jgi:rfaE bifunctional protein nucleotidyltransferase chain/domain
MSAILSLDDLAREATRLHAEGRRLVLTNGCFDLLHAGHVDYLERARALGDALAVALNSDRSVRELKGPSRPVNCEQDRARVMSALRAVDYVVVFDSLRVTDVIRTVRPALYAKGGDYTVETLDAGERTALQEVGTEIHILPLVPGRSTTAILARAAQPEKA